MMKDKTKRISIIASYIEELLKEKHVAGYDYRSEELVLNRFDKYCFNNKLDTLNINKEFLSGWMERTENEGAFNQGKRISCVRQLLLYIATCGIEVYIPHDFCHFTRALPHIFEQAEIDSFFKELDVWQPRIHRATEVRLHVEYRLIFRLYCCLGLRNSEAAGIASEDVNFKDGILTILNSKGYKDRLVYLPDDLAARCSDYYDYLCNNLEFYPKWFFPGMNPEKPLPNTSIDNVFKRFWNKTPYANCNNEPTVHDFRFTFVVRRMNLWAEQGLDLKVMMPYLSRYLGHKSTNETFYYYYLVNDAYKTIVQRDSMAIDVIPEVKHYE